MSSTLVEPERKASSSPVPGHWGTDALLVLMALIWGVNFIVVKVGARLLQPLAFNSGRVTIAAVALIVIVLAIREPWPSRRDTVRLLALGVLGNGLYQWFFIEGISRTRAGDAALVLAAAPALMAIIGRVLGVERVTRRRVLGIAASLFGMALVVFGSGKADPATRDVATLTGNMLVLAACVCWALYTVLLKPYTERVPGIPLSALTMVGGAIPLVAVSVPQIAGTPWTALPVSAWGALLYSGLLALAVAYLFWYRGVRVLGPTRSAMYSNLQPVVALIVAWIALGEKPTVIQVLGAVAIMTGLLMTRA
jgi:drug/metabolite transporter (DMT)-like permease